jgi:hypothetical protein
MAVVVMDTAIAADTDIVAATRAAIAAELQDAATSAVVIAVAPRRHAADLPAVRHAVADLVAAHAADSRAAVAGSTAAVVAAAAADAGKL